MRAHGVECLVLAVLAACSGRGDDSGDPQDSDDTGVAPEGCRQTPAAPDRVRYAVVAHPFAAGGGVSYEVLALDTTGALTRTGHTFDMGRAFEARIVFTPDGSLGIVPQDDGTLGVFTLAADGTPTVVDPGYAGLAYAEAVSIDPSGERAVIVDPNWPENDGGLYAVDIDCQTGALSGDRLLVSTKSAAAVLTLPSGAVVVAKELDGDVSTGAELYRVGPGAWTAPSAHTTLFPDDEAIVGSATLAGGGRYALVGDNSGFSTAPNRVAVVDLDDGATTVQVLSPVADPVELLASPFGNAALVVSGFDDAIRRLGIDPTAALPVTNHGELAYTGAAPELPSKGAVVERGALRGLALVAENTGIRVLRFQADGSVTDAGRVGLGTGNGAITGAIGLQP